MARAGDEVAFGLENRCVPADAIWRRVDAALAAVDFPYDRDRPTHALSGGEQQRLALAATLALRAGLLLLDEPTANLDPEAAAEIRAVVGQARRAARRDARSSSSTASASGCRSSTGSSSSRRAAGSSRTVRPHTLFAEHGARLADAGVWIPDQPPAGRATPRAAAGRDAA